MKQELKNDLIAIYNEIEEAKRNIHEGGDVWEAEERLENAKYWLEKYVSKEDVLKDLKSDK